VTIKCIFITTIIFLVNSDADVEKLCQKLQRAYLRRDHYAQLYYETKAELDETKQQLNVAHGKIKQLETKSKPM